MLNIKYTGITALLLPTEEELGSGTIGLRVNLWSPPGVFFSTGPLQAPNAQRQTGSP